MTGPRHDRLLRVLAKALGTRRLLLIGDRGMIKIVAPGMTYVLAPRDREPACLRNRYFSLSFGPEPADARHQRALERLSAATQAYARRAPWLVAAVAAGRVFLKDGPALRRHLAAQPTKYAGLFDELATLRADAGTPGGVGGLVDFDALRGLFLRLAAATGSEAEAEAKAEPAAGRPAALPGGRRLLFINFLHNAGGLGTELSRWAAARRVEVAGASDWRGALARADRRTVVFCFGLQHDPLDAACVRELLSRAPSLRHVVFADLGTNFDPRPLPPRLLEDGRFSFFLTGTVNYFGALHGKLPRANRLPYIPAVSRDVLRGLLPVEPLYDFFFCAQSSEQNLDFLLRHEAYFRRKRLLIGTKGGFQAVFPEIRRRFPKALFIPRVSRAIYLNLWRLARMIVIMYPEDWRKTSFTMADALLSGRAVVTSAHPAVADIPPSCFLLHDASRRPSDRRLDARATAAAAAARAFALRRLELSSVIDDVVAKTLRRLA